MTRFAVVPAVIFALALATFSQTVLKVGSHAPSFTATSYEGTRYDLNGLHGTAVVLTFWSTRCVICQSEMPKVDQLAQRYSGKKVLFLSATPEDESLVKYYLSLNRIRSTILPNSFGLMLQYADHDDQGNVNIAYPAFFIIDGAGTLQYRGSGYSKTAAVASTLDRLLRN